MSDSLETRVRRLEAEAFRRSQEQTAETLVGKGLAEMLRQVASLQISVGELEKRVDWLEEQAVAQVKLLERIAAKLEA